MNKILCVFILSTVLLLSGCLSPLLLPAILLEAKSVHDTMTMQDLLCQLKKEFCQP